MSLQFLFCRAGESSRRGKREEIETIRESSSGRLYVCVDVCLTIRSFAVVRCDKVKEEEVEDR